MSRGPMVSILTDHRTDQTDRKGLPRFAAFCRYGVSDNALSLATLRGRFAGICRDLPGPRVSANPGYRPTCSPMRSLSIEN